MKKSICHWLLYRWFGFKETPYKPWPKKCVIALAPHTSNWDFIIGVLFMWSHREQCNFLMKKEWFFWPMGIFMRHVGGIPVYREKNRSMTDQLAERAKEMEQFHLCITPEGTRRATTEWKKGFFYIAQKAGIPILVYGLDFSRKLIIDGEWIYPTAETDADETLDRMKQFYKDMKGKKPEKFAI
ncbi:MAG: 1-acyl-sn-glycerol-3-phosphate acyltransferase [Bacteroidaceae bacterium]|nr:1-acyl-sn-glycerol-3-phosphate acyltransferase [Bacteroidaceae bacterium]